MKASLVETGNDINLHLNNAAHVTTSVYYFDVDSIRKYIKQLFLYKITQRISLLHCTHLKTSKNIYKTEIVTQDKR